MEKVDIKIGTYYVCCRQEYKNPEGKLCMKKVKHWIILIVIFIPLFVSCSNQNDNSISAVTETITTIGNSDISVETPMTISSSMFTFNGKTAYLRLKMIKGRYYEDWNPGAIMGTIWEGYYTAELADEYGGLISKSDFSRLYNSSSEPLVFRSSFDIEFDDYNDDGDVDFTVGQYSSSNGRDYKLFTVRKDGGIEELPVRDYKTLFISDTTGYYSTKLTMVDKTTFKRSYYDNSAGKQFEDYFKWEGTEFIHVNKKEDETEEANKSDDSIASNPEVIENLKQIEVENLNDSENKTEKILLPEGWYAKAYIYDKAHDFEFQDDKNKHIQKVSWYQIFNDEKKDTLFYFGSRGIAGEFNTLSYYREEPEITRFPNHSEIKSKEYAGKTILGNGEIYLLTCDIADMLKTKEYDTHEMVYAWIPINNEELAFVLSVNVPLGEKAEPYIELVEQILKILR